MQESHIIKLFLASILLGIFVISSKIGNIKVQVPEIQVPSQAQPLAGLTPNLYARSATSSTLAVGPQEVRTLFTERDNCATRLVTTVASPIMLAFNTDVTAGGLTGHLQAASTTIAYTADVYGCGTVTVYGFASSTITRTEFAF